MLPTFIPTEDNLNLLINEAGLNITTNVSLLLNLWVQAIDCYLCDLIKLTEIKSDRQIFKFSTTTDWKLKITDENNNTFCEEDQVSFEEYGIYKWNLNNFSNCSIKKDKQLKNKFLPAIYVIIIILLSIITLKFIKYIIHTTYLQRLINQFNFNIPTEVDTNVRPIISENSSSVHIEQKRRIRSLDTFRGITIALMIFSNYGGGAYWFFQHSPWNGITIADLIFPWFTWIMGFSIAIKIKSELRNRNTRIKIIYNLIIRSTKLLCIGIVITNFEYDDVKTLRLPGVLQRLGICYFIISLMESIFMKSEFVLQDSRFCFVQDFIESWKQWTFVILVQLIHLTITFLLCVPNCPVGYLGPGGYHNHSLNFNCTGGAARYIDKLILTEQHLYKRATCLKLYKCLPYDPEGILGILTMILCTYFGTHAGRISLIYKSSKSRILRWLLWSFITLLFAGFLCNFSKEEGPIPLNKNLSSLSYVLLSSGLAFLCVSILYFMLDKKSWWNGSPFFKCGVNSLLLFIGHEITTNTFPWRWNVWDPSSHTEYLIMSLWGTFLWILTAIILYDNKIFFSV